MEEDMAINVKALQATEKQLWDLDLKVISAAIRAGLLKADEGAQYISLKEKVRTFRAELDKAA
jgi:hypothetical protein